MSAVITIEHLRARHEALSAQRQQHLDEVRRTEQHLDELRARGVGFAYVLGELEQMISALEQEQADEAAADLALLEQLNLSEQE